MRIASNKLKDIIDFAHQELNSIYENNENNEIFVGDFLGNGKSDILVIYDIEGVSYYELSSFENDKITRLQLKCYPISFNNRKTKKTLEKRVFLHYSIILETLTA